MREVLDKFDLPNTIAKLDEEAAKLETPMAKVQTAIERLQEYLDGARLRRRHRPD
jgi:hypothetical protein